MLGSASLYARLVGLPQPLNPLHTYSILLCVLHIAVVVAVVFVFTLNRPFYPASSVQPVSVVIPYPREIPILWSQTVRRRKTKKYKMVANSSVKHVECQRPGYENTTTQARPEIKTERQYIQTPKSEMKNITNDASTPERLPDGKHT